ncbi:hypothetical protein G6F68_021008 [Rhizopus microsporus]|nr:hypothetical protein G6F68_021008 [Rhizopus microsporus]
MPAPLARRAPPQASRVQRAVRRRDRNGAAAPEGRLLRHSLCAMRSAGPASPARPPRATRRPLLVYLPTGQDPGCRACVRAPGSRPLARVRSIRPRRCALPCR